MKGRRHRFLLAFYPRAWRRRYGEEFTQLLADLEAEQPGGRLRRAVDVVLHALPVQLIYRPAATALVVFLTGGAMATAGVLVQVPATSQEGVITSPWEATHQDIIVRSGKHTYMAPKGYAVHDGPKSQQVVRIQATAPNGAKVTLYCRAGVCHQHRPRR
jgi:hypothetical protein